MTYEFDQTFIPESFHAIYIERGRPILGKADLARRYELCEDLAQQLAESAGALQSSQGLSTDEVLSRSVAGLSGSGSGVSEPEAVWVARRAAELLEQAAPSD